VPDRRARPRIRAIARTPERGARRCAFAGSDVRHPDGTHDHGPAARETLGALPDRQDQADRAQKIAADAKLDETHGDIENLVRAWSAPAFKGHIYLERRGANWCLSAPDPLSPMPDIERGMGCNAGEYGASLTIGRNYAAVILDDSVKPPLLERADGSRTTLTPDAGGLIALANVPDGTSVTLYNAEGKGRRDPVAR
jgi:hypothetical protein